jgi:hypothetical protein
MPDMDDPQQLTCRGRYGQCSVNDLGALEAAGMGLAAGARPDTIRLVSSPDAGLPGNIGAPATRALIAAGYTELTQLANVPAAELAKLHGVGPKALRLLQEALEQRGMSLG